MMARLAALLFAAAFMVGGAWAQSTTTIPQPGPGDPRIREVLYSPHQVVGLRGHLGYQMMIEFGAGEEIENVSVGDSIAWQVAPNRRGTLLFVKPVERAATTNLTVVTNQRQYAFELTSSEARGANDPNIIFLVRFNYPAPPPVVVDVPPPVETAPKPEDLNFAYSQNGSRRIAPVTVFDDGTFTYFQFPPEMDAPAIFTLGPDGSEGLVNARPNDRYVVVDLVGRAFVLRHGREKLTITNTAYAGPDAEPSRREPRQRGRGGRP
jgi:type IV secretion system protein VirB9